MEKLDYLIKYLIKENKEIKVEKIPMQEEDKKKLYRSLCNIRPPNQISEKYIEVENEYLKGELANKNITKVEEIETVSKIYKENNLKNSDKICLWQGDITTLQIEAIVNAANSQGIGCFVPLHNCIDNQIGSSAGILLRLECNEIMKNKNYNLKTGEAIITKGYNLPAKYIIHTVGPIIYKEVLKSQEKELANCYINSLKLAIKTGIRTISFPCISTGEFRYPKDQACKIAIKTVDNFLINNKGKFDKVVFNLYSKENVLIYEESIK